MQRDRPSIGLSLMLGFCVLAPLGDGIAKLIGNSVPLATVVGVRFAAQALLLVPLTSALGLSLAVPRGLLGLIVVRTVLHIAGIALIFLALRYLPLADAIAIAYVMPFIVLLFGWLALGEEVGWRRLLACVVGFLGTILVIQPSFRDIGAVALLPLAVAVIFAAFMLLTRRVAREIGPIELQAVNGLIGTAAIVPVLLLGAVTGAAELRPVWPDAQNWGLLTVLGVLGTLAHLLLSWSLRYAPAATLAPIQYFEIPMAAVIGFAMFREFPNGLALIGIAVVMCAGLYVILRERTLARAVQP